MLTLGISGYLWRSAVLYHDEQSETFWSQMTGRAHVGPRTGARLTWIPTEVTSWKDWRARHPATTVLKPPWPVVSYGRIGRQYDAYRRGGRHRFPLADRRLDRSFAEMAPVTIVRGPEGGARAYVHETLPEGGTRDGERTVRRRGDAVTVIGADGEPLPTMTAYWFAWCTFYPDGTVYDPEAPRAGEDEDDD